MKKQKPLGTICLKVTSQYHKALQIMADKHAGGNLSLWLRYAGLMYTPKKPVTDTISRSIPNLK
jgi:hypothetical protein